MLACRTPTTAPTVSTPPHGSESNARVTQPEPEPEPADALEEAPAEHTALVVPSESADDGLPPLPKLDLTPGHVDAVARDACLAQHSTSAETSAPQLYSAAQCLGDAGAFGHEIRLLTVLVHEKTHADAYQAALVRLGLRYEQVGHTANAIDTYLDYIRKYAKGRETMSLAKRGLCLAWSMDDTHRFAQLSTILRQYYRKIYCDLLPADDEVQALCRNARSP